MLKIFNKIRNKLPKVLLLALAVSVLHSISPDMVAHAQNILDPEQAKGIEGVASFLISVQGLLNHLLWPVLFMIGGLLDNSILFGSDMEARMREIWIPIRNLVNIMVVLVLVGLALYNVTGLADDGNASIKALLPKLILGIILINFSFVGIKVALDAINVVTVSIMALPDQVSEGMPDANLINNPNAQKRLCLAMAKKSPQDTAWQDETGLTLAADQKLMIYKTLAGQFPIQGSTAKDLADSAKAQIDAGVIDGDKYQSALNLLNSAQICDGFELTDMGKTFLGSYKGQNAALLMAISMGRVVYYQEIEATVDSIEKLVTSVMLSVLLYVVYTVSFVALFIILLTRLVVLWVVIVMSPILAVTIAVPAIGNKISILGDITSKFVKHAIAPIIVAVSMTIGWIMLKSMQSVESVGRDTTLNTIINGAGSGLPVVGLSTLQDLIIGSATIAVVWMGVFAAAEGTIAEKLTSGLKTGMEGLGKFIAGAPMRFNFIPVKLPGDQQAKPYSANQVMQALRDSKNQQEGNIDDLSRKIYGDRISQSLDRIGRTNTALDVGKIFAGASTASNEDLIKGIKEITIQAMADIKNDPKNAALYQILEKIRKESDIKKIDKKDVQEAQKGLAELQ